MLRRRSSYDKLVQQRTKRVFGVLAIAYILLAGRLFYLQVIRAPHFKARAEDLIVARITLLARRGTIYDRNGSKLAMTVDAFDVGVRPSAIPNKADTAARLSPIMGIEEGELLGLLRKHRRFFYLARGLDVKVGEKIRDEKIPGIDALRVMKRVYPGGPLAAHVIGFTNIDGRGIAGLEKVFDDELRGKDGYVIAERDARGRIIPGSRRERVEPVNGRDLVLTIDSTLQHAVETYLDKESFSKYSAAGASAIAMDPKTGEILALANYPTFDPNNVREADPASQRNRAVTDLYEPGSTLKTITACAGLEEKAIGADDTFFCSGSMTIGRRTIRCSLHPPFMNGHGTCDVAKILCHSCNMGAAGIGLKLGPERLYKYEAAFGLYEKPGSGMYGETYCRWHDTWRDWPSVRLANIAFGQGIVVTPLQMTRAYCAVANGGVLMRARVVKEIRRQDGTPVRSFSPQITRRVISEQTAQIVSEALLGVTTDGTGKPARVEGYKVCGKTGSAQKASTTGRGYAAGKFIASFVGFLPETDPRMVILVAVDEPKQTHWGATAAAPVFREVARTAMWYMKVPPDDKPPLESPPIADEPDDGGQPGDDPRPGRPRLGG